MNSLGPMTRVLLKEIFRKKDFYVALILGGAVVGWMASADFYGVSKVSRYLLETGLTLVFWFSAVLTASLAARQYPAEKESKTLEVILSKPVSRLDFLASKWAGSFFAGSAAFLLFYVLFMGAAFARMESLDLKLASETAVLFIASLAVLSAMASALSYYFTVSASVTLTLLFYFLMQAYGASLKALGAPLPAPGRVACEIFYYALPHFEFFDLRQRFVHNWGPVSSWLVAALVGYAAVYTFVFLAAAWLGFRKRTL